MTKGENRLSNRAHFLFYSGLGINFEGFNVSPNWLRLRAQAFLFAKGMLHRMTFGARGILVNGDEVLMIRHTYVPGWHFPGGGVDPGENAEAAFRREMLEETGYQVLGEAQLLGLYHNVGATNRDHVALYVAREFEVVRTFAPNREIAEMAWINRYDLPEDVSRGTHQRLHELFDGVAQSPDW